MVDDSGPSRPEDCWWRLIPLTSPSTRPARDQVRSLPPSGSWAREGRRVPRSSLLPDKEPGSGGSGENDSTVDFKTRPPCKLMGVSVVRGGSQGSVRDAEDCREKEMLSPPPTQLAKKLPRNSQWGER